MSSARLDVLVVGAGFSGLYAVHKAREAGFRVGGVEAAPTVGGTWYWNRYPGARCDVESLDYSYSFDEALQREWRWSERYATQPEILAYAEHVADRFDVRGHIDFSRKVVAAHFRDDTATWTVSTDTGHRYSTRFLVFATGSLSAPHQPGLPGFADFTGEVLFTARWPEEGADLTGKRVGVIGTGSSGIQSVPIIAEQAASVTVFQRSANYSVPAGNRPLTDADQVRAQRDYPQRRRKSWASTAGSPHDAYPGSALEVDEDTRREVFEARWQQGGVLFGKTFPQQTIDERVNRLARDFAEAKIRAIVRDPRTADDLVPTDHPIGTKRICTDSGYFETFNLPHVTLVNLRREPITTLTANGIRTSEAHYELDTLVLATGFDAMTGALTRIDISGPRENHISSVWGNGPLTYLGVGIPGLPNLFSLTGPGSPSVLANMILAAEQQVNWLVELLRHCAESGFTQVEPRRDAAQAWTRHVDEVAGATLFPKAASWYMGANIAGKPQGFMPYIGGFAAYGEVCDAVRDAGYRGFVFTS
ncbi:NAD(P)/FAD-dependent oxidoreductase [Saccharomonospora sp. NPDC006951]